LQPELLEISLVRWLTHAYNDLQSNSIIHLAVMDRLVHNYCQRSDMNVRDVLNSLGYSERKEPEKFHAWNTFQRFAKDQIKTFSGFYYLTFRLTYTNVLL